MNKLMTIVLLNFNLLSYACSCDLSVDMIERFASAKIVVSGEVKSVQYCELDNSRSVKIYSIDIVDIFKGYNGEYIEIITGIGNGDCGEHFVIGEDYVIFLYDSQFAGGKEGTHETNICMGNIPICESSESLEKLYSIKLGDTLE